MTSQQNIFSLQIMLEGCEFFGKLGASPLGTLYHIQHPDFGECVLKHFQETACKDKAYIAHFLSPLEKFKDIQHPNLAKVYHWQIENQAFVIRELIVGMSLEEKLKTTSSLPPLEATQILWDVAMGLFAGYPLGLVYRNVKPTNIILNQAGVARLVDISLPPTNPYFVAPEQWLGQKSDIRSDIYSIGVTYYQMLTGKYPCGGETKEEIKQQHLTQAPKFPEMAGIADILKTMLAKAPEERYHSPLPLLGALRGVLKKMGVEVKPMAPAMMPPTGELKKNRPKEEAATTLPDATPLKSGYTSMMVAVSRKQLSLATDADKDAVEKRDITEEPTRKVTAGDLAALSLPELPPAEPPESRETHIEEVYLSRHVLAETPAKALERITHIPEQKERRGSLPTRLVHFPKEFENLVVEYLQKIFRRETWLLKESAIAGEMEVAIDLEQSYVLRHFYGYEDKLQEALQEMPADEIVGSPTPPQGTAPVGSGETINLTYEPETKDNLPREKPQLGGQETISMDEEEVIKLAEYSEPQPAEKKAGTADGQEPNDGYCLETINDITIKSKANKSATHASTTSTKPSRRLRSQQLEVTVDFANMYETMGWIKFVREHNLKKGEHFDNKGGPEKGGQENDAKKIFVIYLEKLENYHKEQEYIIRIKEFFQGDYDITELDRGGMGVVLKLIAKNDPTILSLRAENYWARQRFAEYLHVRRDTLGREIIYAEIPRGTEFVVKVAFEGYEESLIQEAGVLSRVAEDPNVCQTIIGSVQQGRLFTLDDKADQTQIGYYLMLEYAAQGNTEQLYHRFPDGKLSPTTGFAIMYGMVQTLQKLKQKGIIHRDIKPHNILIDKNGVPKLSDFGLAMTTKKETGDLTEERRRLLRIMDPEFLQISTGIERVEGTIAKLEEKRKKAGEHQEHEKGTEASSPLDRDIQEQQCKLAELRQKEQERAVALKNKYRVLSAEENAGRGKFAGSLHYAAVEQFDTDAVLTPQCDVYQLGACMFTLLTGRRPVEGRTTLEIMSKVVQPERPKVADIIKGNPLLDAMSQVIETMMAHKAEDRANIDDVRERLDQILFEYALELKQMPTYSKPAHVQNQEQEEKWARRVALAQELHHKCLKLIFSTIFQNQDLPSLSKDVGKIVFSCPHCHKKLHVYKYMNGKKGTCPGCRRHILVKLADTEM